MTFRHLARVGTAGLIAAGTLAAAAVPAYAADVDFGVGLKGTTIAADASGKLGLVNITNYGSGTPAKVNVLFDVTKLDQSKVVVPEPGDCTFVDDVADCPIVGDLIPGPGGTVDLPIPLIKQAGATGAAGQLTVTVVVAGDTNKANDSKTVDVSVGGHGVDLGVVVPDVTMLDADDIPTGKPIPPGGSSAVQGIVINWGDTLATGLHVTVALPKHVTFPDVEGCTLAADKRTVDCVADNLPLTPADRGTGGGTETSTVGFMFPVTVAADAPGPVTLTGGAATVAATGQEPVSSEAARTLARNATAVLPKNFHRLTGAELAAVDVDGSDNVDEFAVLVAAGQPGGGTGGGGGGTGEGGGLPITGPVAASVAGTGAVVIAIGVILFVMSRRRRVVLVVPEDVVTQQEK